jgi:hypothetical protein
MEHDVHDGKSKYGQHDGYGADDSLSVSLHREIVIDG